MSIAFLTPSFDDAADHNRQRLWKDGNDCSISVACRRARRSPEADLPLCAVLAAPARWEDQPGYRHTAVRPWAAAFAKEPDGMDNRGR